ncbi:MAG: hypothetical protein AAF638_03305 [Pseudomonadota bacterium]
MADRLESPADDPVLDTGIEAGIRLTVEQQKRRRARSIAIACVLVGLIVLFYVITLVKMGPAIFDRAL